MDGEKQVFTDQEKDVVSGCLSLLAFTLGLFFVGAIFWLALTWIYW
jgi:hypothetical protein